MKPSFALSLSFEGIDLLHRADDGWRAVGRVAFEDEDLGAALTGLREQALLLSPEGITSKLILPEDQIKYVSVPVGKAPATEHESLAHAAIEGTTPYALADLAIDWQLNGPVLEVAAVARETLAEAEAFAHEHQFNPVSFVAQPAGPYPGEPFFGGTHAATELFGGRVEPDEDAVAVIGPAKFPAPEPEVSEPVPEPEVIAAPALETIAPPAIDETPAEGAVEAPQPEVTPAPVAEQPAPPVPEPAAESTPEPIEAITAPAVEVIDQPVDYAQMAASIEDELSPAIPLTPEELELIEAAEARGNVEGPEDTAEIPSDLEELQHDLFAAPQAEVPAEPTLPNPEDILAVDAPATAGNPVEATPDTLPPMFGSSRAKAAQAETPAGEEAPKPEANSALSFASVRARRGATDEDTGKAAPRLDGASRTSPEVNGVRKLTLRPDKAAATPAETGTDEAGTGAPALDVDVNAPTVPPISDEAAPAVNGAAPSGGDISEDAEAQLLDAAASLTPAIEETEIPPAPAETDAPEAAVEVPAPGKAPSRRAKRQQEARKEKQQMTVFGARKSEQEVVVGGKPRFLGLILTALLLLFLVGMAAWASLGEEGIAGLFRSSEPTTTAEVLQAEAEQEAAPAEDLAAATAPAAAADQPVATPAPQEAETTLAEVDLPAVEGTAVEAAPDTSEVASLSPELQYEPEAPAAPDAATSALTDPALVEGDEALTALDPELQAEPEITETAPAPELSTAERYAVSGVWQDAPAQPSAPATAGLGDLYIASIDPAVPSFDAVALPDEARVQSDTTPPQQNSPAAAGTEFTFDQRGLVTASPEGTMTPDGILIFSGRPPVLPNSFPARTVVAPEGISEAELLRRSKIRPKARPEDLIESNERSVLGGRTRTELAQLRPKARPDNLRTAANSTDDGDRLALLNSASAPLVDLSGETRDAINEAVAQSVGATSLRPMARPSNLNTSNTESVQVAAAVRVQPQLPTSASVARQATVKNQLNLRKINLIGVSGQPSNRSALVRLASGRYKKVSVGDRLDGGRVASISEGELRYTKSGRTITLKMPRG
ncbi:hypothetical protein TL5118_03628 [Thalassovita autumnalis]|uniref:Type IV pilus biogenesis protein PilP n=1 Tax=Thalassovita autumnalis TaxID=2072972 RepID=A0ABM9UHE6_9RHOB|nr:hypothetical protein [Thalassovita autumnalis]CUH69658.1 hypothetical protein TL5118_03628 [Thalassovita autumnalis]